MERLSKEQIEAVIQEAKERCPYYGEPDGCNAHGGPLMCCDELDEVGELAKTACSLGPVEELSALVMAKDEGRSQFANDAGGVLLHYIREQRRLMRDIASAPDEPRKDIMYRHEADKLYMLESIAIDAGHDMQRTVTYDRAEAEAAIGGGGDG